MNPAPPMSWLVVAKRNAVRGVLRAMVGRPRQLVVVALLAFVVLLALACIGRLLELPGPPRSLWVLIAELFDARLYAERVRGLSAFWSATPTMRVLAGMFVGIDTLLFVPLYAVLFTGLRARRNRSVPHGLRAVTDWRRWRWLLAAAVAADLAENGLTWLAVQGRVCAMALQYAEILKWTSVLAMLLVIAAMALARASWARPGQWCAGVRRVLEVLRDAARYLWLYAIPLFMLFGGLAMLAGVPQTREIIADLGDATTGPASRLTTLAVTSFMLVVWIAACGFAFALVSKVDPLTPREGPALDPDQAAVLQRTHQVVVGLAALVATNVVLLRMSAQQGAALSLFIVVGCIGLWVVTARACTIGFKLAGLPRHRQARPVAWRSVALLMLLYVLVVAAWRFLPDPREADLRSWGLYRKPDALWRFNPDLIEAGALHFLLMAAIASALFVCALLIRRRSAGRRLLAGTAFLAGMLIWAVTAWSRLGLELLVVQTATIVLASIALWLLTHRTTLAEYQKWQDHFFGEMADAVKWPGWLSRWIRDGLPGLGSTLTRNVAKSVVGLVALFFMLPHAGDPVLFAQTGTLAVVFAALSIWGLFATWLLVFLPMRKGLGNWTLAPLLWLAAVSLLPRADVRVDRLDNPAVQAAATEPADRGNVAAPTLHAHFAAWRQLLPDGQRSPVFVVAAAGGGLRAAYWTAILLAEMDDRSCGQFGRHVLAASGVSGGSLGLALYAAQRQAWQRKPLPERCQPGRAAQMRQVLSGDFLAPIAAGLLFADAPMAFVPFVSLQRDRTDALSLAVQRRWEKAFEGDTAAAGLLAQPMRQALPALFEAPAAKAPEPARQAHPVLYLNATSVETGRRVIASNVTLGTIPADPLFYEEPVSRGTRLLTARTSLLDAALHSARFPVISSAGKVLACTHHGSRDAGNVCTPDSPPYGLLEWGHLLDGGYFENSGIETLGDALLALQSHALSPSGSALPPVFLIAISNDAGTRTVCPRAPTPRFPVIGADPGQLALHRLTNVFQEAGPTWRGGEAVDGLPATWQALLSVRAARARLELERVVQRLGCPYVLEWSLGEHLALGLRERGTKDAPDGRRDLNEPALGWLLSATSMRRMDEGVARYAKAFPFDLAACQAREGPLPRGLIGARQDADVRCSP